MGLNMEKKINITQVIPFKNEQYEGVRFLWEANGIGFGQYDIYREVSENNDVEWKADSEMMDLKNDNKTFLRMLIDNWINEIKVMS